MYKELFENKKTIIFDLNSILKDIHEVWIQSIDKVLSNLNLGYIGAKDSYVIGRDITVNWNLLLSNPEIHDKKIPIDTLINNTYTKFVETMKEKETFELKEGFEDFIEELKEEKKGIRLILKSPYPESITSLILEKYYLEGIFNNIETTPLINPEKDLVKEIIKKNKLIKKEVLVFEESLYMTKKLDNEGIMTVILWDNETPREKYPTNVILFIENYETFIGNLDKTYLETMEMVQEYSS
jgi:beta-phosphoglucomutase-like phosphatase (HAD superfamily)